jgi:hypothetical protein
LFGTFNNALKAAGLDINTLANLSITTKIELRLDSITKFKTIHNRWPNIDELRIKNNLPSYHWANDHFGSYEKLKIHLENLISDKI